MSVKTVGALIAGFVVAGLTACSAGEGGREKARLLEWRKLTIEQALTCDNPMFAMNQAMESGDLVTGSAKASETARVCKEAAALIARFGELPGVGIADNSSTNHPCGLDSLATSSAAQQTIALIDGDMRPSVMAGIKAALDERTRNMAACKSDMAARAKFLGIAEPELDEIVRQSRLQVTGSEEQRTMGKPTDKPATAPARP